MSTNICFNVSTGKEIKLKDQIGTLAANKNPNPTMEQMRNLFASLKINNFAPIFKCDSCSSEEDDNEGSEDVSKMKLPARLQRALEISMMDSAAMYQTTVIDGKVVSTKKLSVQKKNGSQGKGLHGAKNGNQSKNGHEATNGHKCSSCVKNKANPSGPPFGGGEISYTFSRGDDPSHPEDIVVHISTTVPIKDIKAEMRRMVPPTETGFKQPITVLEAMMLKAMATGTFLSKNGRSVSKPIGWSDKNGFYPKTMANGHASHDMASVKEEAITLEEIVKSNLSEYLSREFSMPDPVEMSPKKKVEKCPSSKCTNIFCPGNYGYQPNGAPSPSNAELPDDDNLFSNYIEKELSRVSSPSSFGSRISSVRNYKELLSIVQSSDSAMAEIHMFTSYVIDSLEKMPPAKDVKTAQSLRSEGNDFYNRSSFWDALKKYNDAILMAPGPEEDPTKELAKCFNNRSLLFYNFNHFKECILDINEAIKCGYTSSGCKNSLITLLKRKIKCYRQINAHKSVDKLMRKATGVIKSEEELNDLKSAVTAPLEMKPFMQSVDFNMKGKYVIKNKHKLIREVSDAIEMTNEGRRGLRLRAARRISPNEVINVVN